MSCLAGVWWSFGDDDGGGEFAEHLLGGDLLVHDQHARVGAGDGLPVAAKGGHFAGLAGLGQIGVGVDEVVCPGVLGEGNGLPGSAVAAGGMVGDQLSEVLQQVEAPGIAVRTPSTRRAVRPGLRRSSRPSSRR